jgi:uncharacterized integral membrane protein (TIGR00698 family)
MIWVSKHGIGLAYVLVIAIVAFCLGTWLPIVGGPAFGLLLGLLISNTFGRSERAVAGILFCSKKILQWAIILLGCGLSLTQIWETGSKSLLVMFSTLAVSFISAYTLGRLMKVPDNLNTLIAVGTGICGGSAIAAVSPIIQAKNHEITYGISIIFLLNLAAVLIFPAIGSWMHLSHEGFGLWAGTAIHDTSSAVAAGYLFSDEAGAYATIVKLTRTTLIIPIVLMFAFIMSKRNKQTAPDYSIGKIFPWFIVWFIAASLLNTVGLISKDMVEVTNRLAKFMITMTLSAIGLSADLKSLIGTGFKPILLGIIVWVAVSATSLLMQAATNHW